MNDCPSLTNVEITMSPPSMSNISLASLRSIIWKSPIRSFMKAGLCLVGNWSQLAGWMHTILSDKGIRSWRILRWRPAQYGGFAMIASNFIVYTSESSMPFIWSVPLVSNSSCSYTRFPSSLDSFSRARCRLIAWVMISEMYANADVSLR